MTHTNTEHVVCCLNSLIGMIFLPSFLPFPSVLASGHAASTSHHETYRRKSIAATANRWLMQNLNSWKLRCACYPFGYGIHFHFLVARGFCIFARFICYHFMSTQVGRPTYIQYPWCTHAAPLHNISIQYWPCFQLICLQTQHQQFWMIWTTMWHQWQCQGCSQRTNAF